MIKRTDRVTALATAALERIEAWSKKCGVPYAGADYLNGDDGRTDGKDAWDDLDEIVAEALAELRQAER